MRLKKRHTALDTNAGKYSHRKVPHWKIGLKDITDYLQSLTDDHDDLSLDFKGPLPALTA